MNPGKKVLLTKSQGSLESSAKKNPASRQTAQRNGAVSTMKSRDIALTQQAKAKLMMQNISENNFINSSIDPESA
jgi:hypothetical protein